LRKVLVSQDGGKKKPAVVGEWLDIAKIATAEISSEDPGFPIDDALEGLETAGWRAAGTGPQRIRLLFDKPQRIRRIQLHFVDRESERSQEFRLLALVGNDLRDVARQQWNFSPSGAMEELEDYRVELDGVNALELRIDPDRSHDPKQSRHVASLQRLRIA
jgi:Anaphase-promoting complex, subunit 10 (APC10)